jgi:3-isopropylmalate/(R)-2-methylmalate dehydratase small subunit
MRFTELSSTVVVLPAENIDTDQIIPARFLKVTDKQGLGQHLFEDLRRHADGTPRADFPLNREPPGASSILVAGRNFGCGSSREHAPWSLVGAGFRAVISTSFADIFRGNALKNGLLPVVVGADAWSSIAALEGTSARVTVDLVNQEVRWPGARVAFAIDAFARTCLLAGTDELGYILHHQAAIAAFEARHLQ